MDCPKGAVTTERSLLLLSGGIDSVALAWWHRPAAALVVDYGQRSAEGEIRAARTVARLLNMPLDVLVIDCRELGHGDLAGGSPHPLAPVSEWWPYRNQLLLTFGGCRALDLHCDRIWLGCVAGDNQHADGTKEFVTRANALLNAQEGELQVEAPAIEHTSEDLVVASKIPRSILAWSHSCHTSPLACGMCRGCAKHREIFAAVWGNDATY